MSKCLVLGRREETLNGVTTEVRDVIGSLDRCIGEEGFGKQYLELVTARYGSLDEFLATYPRGVCLEW